MAEKQFPLSVVIRAIDKVTTPIGRIQRSIAGFDERLRNRLAGTVSRIGAIGDRLGLPVFATAAGRAGQAAGQLVGKIAAIGAGVAAAAGAVALGSWEMIKSFTDAASEVNDLSQSLGVSAERLQEWRFAAAQNGVDAELLDKSVGILSKNLGKAFKGKGPAELLGALGVKLKDAHGKFRVVDDILPDIAEGLSKVKNPALKAAAAAELFGKGGVKLLATLNGGKKGLADYAKEARQLGAVIDNDTIAATDDFGDNMDRLKTAMTGVRNSIGSALLPVLNELVLKMTSGIKDNIPRIKAWAQAFAEKLPGTLRQIRDIIVELGAKLRPLGVAIGWLVDHFGAANVIMAAVATALAVFLVPSIYATATAFYALGVAILTTPVGWILAGIVAIAAAAYLIYKNWGPISKFFSTWWDAVKRVFSAVGDFFSGIWDDVKAGFKDGFILGILRMLVTLNPVNLIIRAFTKLGPALLDATAEWRALLMDAFGGIFDWIQRAAAGAWDWLKGAAIAAVRAMVAPWATLGGWYAQLFGFIVRAIKVDFDRAVAFATAAWTAITGAWSGAINWFTGLFGGVTQAISGAWEGIKGIFRAGIDLLTGWLRGLADRFSGIVPDWVRNLVGGRGPNIALNTTTRGAASIGRGAAPAQNGAVRVAVDFNNMPQGTRVRTETRGRPNVQLNQGYATGIPR